MSIIEHIQARQILDSRGNPTVECEIFSESGLMARASVPSGASTGQFEAVELRDNDPEIYGKKSVLKAVDNIEEAIAEELIGLDCINQQDIDQRMIELDATDNKSKLGANAILAVSMANAKLAAMETNLPLYRYLGGLRANLMPTPLMNILNGGKHADNKIDIQEFMVIPRGGESFAHALEMGVMVYKSLGMILHDQGYSTNIGDEGGYAPALSSTKQALDLICQAVEKAGYKLGTDIALALDCAASEFYKDGQYHLSGEGRKLDPLHMCDYLAELVAHYPIISIEDGLAEDDYDSWTHLTTLIGHKTQLVGDDLFCTNIKRLQRGIDQGAANAILIKLNQIGTVSETLATINLAHKSGYKTIISHRSGETEDSFISDLAVAMRSGQIKTGAPARSDRVAKYNQLLRIEDELGDFATFGN